MARCKCQVGAARSVELGSIEYPARSLGSPRIARRKTRVNALVPLPRIKSGVASAALLLALAIGAAGTQAVAYPDRPVRVVVPFPPGGGTDVVGRVLAEKLSDLFGKQFVVENRPGRAPCWCRSGLEIGPGWLHDPVGHVSRAHHLAGAVRQRALQAERRSFSPIALLGLAGDPAGEPEISSQRPARRTRVYQAAPFKVSVASGGSGTAPHLAAELFKSIAAKNLVIVPYKGAAQLATRSDRRTGRSRIFDDRIGAAARQQQQPQGARGHLAQAFGLVAGRAILGRTGPSGARGGHLVRPVRAGIDAERDRGEAARCRRQRLGGSRAAGAVREACGRDRFGAGRRRRAATADCDRARALETPGPGGGIKAQ